MAILTRRLERADELVGRCGDEFRGVLDRLELATERRDPVIADLARQLRNRYYDQPLIAAAPCGGLREIEQHLNALVEDPDRPDRAEQIAALVDTPLMLAPRLIERMSETGAREHPALLEVITRRWYRRRELTEFATAITSDGTAYVTTSYTQNGRRYNLAAALVDVDDLDNVAGAISRRAARYPEEDAIHIDLCANVTADDELAARVKRALEDADDPADRRADRAQPAGAEARRLRRRRDHAAARRRRLELGARPRPAVRAPGNGRAAEPVADVASSRSSGSRRRPTCTCSAASAARIRRTSGCSRSPRSAS